MYLLPIFLKTDVKKIVPGITKGFPLVKHRTVKRVKKNNDYINEDMFNV